MRILLVLGSVLLVAVLNARAAPTDGDDGAVLNARAAPTDGDDGAAPSETVAATQGAVPDSAPVYRKETLDHVSRNTSLANVEKKTKDKVKVITKQRKDGSIVTIIKDKSKTKIKKDELTDSYDQINHRVIEGGVEDSECLIRDKEHESKEVDVIKKVDRERIVTDKYGNVISDTHKTKEKEKVKKKEKDVETKQYVHVHSVKPTTTAAPLPDPTEAPPSDGCNIFTK